MTQNALAYLNLQETERSNKAKEAETYRHDTVTEGETMRSNIARENENIRSNMANEANTRFRNQQEAYHWSTMDAETMRSNMAREHETIRLNNLNYFLGQQNVLNNALGNLNTAVRNAQDYDIANKQLIYTGQNAMIAQQNADTQRYAAEQTAAIGWANVQANMMNASTNWQNMMNQNSRWQSQSWADHENAVSNAWLARSGSALNTQKVKESKTNQKTSVISSIGNLLRGAGSFVN